jgi:hypothetical protein
MIELTDCGLKPGVTESLRLGGCSGESRLSSGGKLEGQARTGRDENPWVPMTGGELGKVCE